MFAIIDLKTKEIVATDVALPCRHRLPDGGTTIFTDIGQTAPAHAPRYQVIATREAVERPAYPVIETHVERALVGDEVVVTRTFAPDLAAFQQAVENHIDATASSRSYSGTVSLASYVTSTVPGWKAEAEAFVTWRDAVWVYALTELEKAQQGARPIPTLDEFITELPVMEWPAQ